MQQVAWRAILPPAGWAQCNAAVVSAHRRSAPRPVRTASHARIQ